MRHICIQGEGSSRTAQSCCCCKCVRGYYRIEQESWEPLTGCAEIQLDKRMRPCFLTSLLFTLHPRASVCLPSPRLPVPPSVSGLLCSQAAMRVQCEMYLFVSSGNFCFFSPSFADRDKLETGRCRAAACGHTLTNTGLLCTHTHTHSR